MYDILLLYLYVYIIHILLRYCSISFYPLLLQE
nr:MAG TPA: hypothetical protein [Caudoviricetes sp.]